MAEETRANRILAKIAGYTREIADDTELAKLALAGELMPYDPVWHPRIARWAHAMEIDELTPFFAEAKANLERRLEEEEAQRAARSPLRRLLDRLLGR